MTSGETFKAWLEFADGNLSFLWAIGVGIGIGLIAGGAWTVLWGRS